MLDQRKARSRRRAVAQRLRRVYAAFTHSLRDGTNVIWGKVQARLQMTNSKITPGAQSQDADQGNESSSSGLGMKGDAP